MPGVGGCVSGVVSVARLRLTMATFMVLGGSSSSGWASGCLDFFFRIPNRLGLPPVLLDLGLRPGLEPPWP